MTGADAIRPGERRIENEPTAALGATLRFIGRLHTPWRERRDCPRNMREARERAAGHVFLAEIDPPYRPALQDLEPRSYATLLTWFDRARRDLALQMPRGASAPRGTFSLRSPVRPNPIGLHLVRLVAIDRDAGHLVLDAADALDGTPLLDIKPYLPSVDHAPQDAP